MRGRIQRIEALVLESYNKHAVTWALPTPAHWLKFWKPDVKLNQNASESAFSKIWVCRNSFILNYWTYAPPPLSHLSVCLFLLLLPPSSNTCLPTSTQCSSSTYRCSDDISLTDESNSTFDRLAADRVNWGTPVSSATHHIVRQSRAQKRIRSASVFGSLSLLNTLPWLTRTRYVHVHLASQSMHIALATVTFHSYLFVAQLRRKLVIVGDGMFVPSLSQ